jgi:hypothetical protein
VNALTSDEVGNYLKDYFVPAFQKVGTFRVVNGDKQGGNVVSYFCLADGSVLHALAGPVDAATFLREARWVVETRKLARSISKGDYARYLAIVRKAHIERLRNDHGENADFLDLADEQPAIAQGKGQRAGVRLRHKSLGLQGQVHWLLAIHPLIKLEKVYPVVFERILGEKLSALPVLEE